MEKYSRVLGLLLKLEYATHVLDESHVLHRCALRCYPLEVEASLTVQTPPGKRKYGACFKSSPGQRRVAGCLLSGFVGALYVQ